MRLLTLREHLPQRDLELSTDEIEQLRSLVPSLTVVPSRTGGGRFDLTPGSDVGTVAVGDLAVEIRPKIGISRLLFLLSYDVERIEWRDEDIDADEEPHLAEVVLAIFERTLRQALGRGVLRGYRPEEAALSTVRGRIDFTEQLRTRFGRMPPVEVRYDEHTEDILVNRLLKAALSRCRALPVRSPALARRLRAFEHALLEVAPFEFDPRALPRVPIDRLNAHYQPALGVASMILRHLSIEQGAGARRSISFLVDMNNAFESFVVVALREALGLDARAFPQGLADRRLHLDVAGRVRLRPDLSWWEGAACGFVGDVKYKKSKASGILHPDLYQLLSYTVALDLPEGLLVYAAGEHGDVCHEVVHLGKRLWVRSLDVSGTPREVLAQIGALSEMVVGMRQTDDRLALHG